MNEFHVWQIQVRVGGLVAIHGRPTVINGFLVDIHTKAHAGGTQNLSDNTG